MEKTDFLIFLVGLVLVVSVTNLYGTFNLYGKSGYLKGGETTAKETTTSLQPITTIKIPTSQPIQQPSIKVSVDDDPVKGQANAPVTMIEFSDFQCPFCGRFFQQTLSKIEENYIKTGKVKFVYRDFPLSFHPQAQAAAEAAECADEQGKFWEMHDKIFQNQQSMSEESYKKWAEEIGLDTEKFNNCLDTGKYAQEVQKDFQDGQKAGVSGTPTFFINGKKIVGAQPYQVFQQAIEAEL